VREGERLVEGEDEEEGEPRVLSLKIEQKRGLSKSQCSSKTVLTPTFK